MKQFIFGLMALIATSSAFAGSKCFDFDSGAIRSFGKLLMKNLLLVSGLKYVFFCLLIFPINGFAQTNATWSVFDCTLKRQDSSIQYEGPHPVNYEKIKVFDKNSSGQCKTVWFNLDGTTTEQLFENKYIVVGDRSITEKCSLTTDGATKSFHHMRHDVQTVSGGRLNAYLSTTEIKLNHLGEYIMTMEGQSIYGFSFDYTLLQCKLRELP